jgi:hypothetical protein
MARGAPAGGQGLRGFNGSPRIFNIIYFYFVEIRGLFLIAPMHRNATLGIKLKITI